MTRLVRIDQAQPPVEPLDGFLEFRPGIWGERYEENVNGKGGIK